MKVASKVGRRSARSASMRRRVNERLDLISVQFALQSLEDDSLFVASEERADIAEAEDDETGVPFTDSMDENIVLVFPTHEEAKQFAEDNDLLDKVRIVTVRVNPDSAEGEEGTEEEDDMEEGCHNMKECGSPSMGESMRLRRNRTRRLGESRSVRSACNCRASRYSRR